MNPSTNTYAQNLRLRKIQNRQHGGQDKFSIGKRGEPIPGKLDSVTIQRRQRRALKRPVNLKNRVKKLEGLILWEQKHLEILEKPESKKQPQAQKLISQHKAEITRLQSVLLSTQASLNALLS